MHASGLVGTIESYKCCPGHMALISTDKCTICKSYTPQNYVTFNYIPLLPRLARLVQSERQCTEMFTYLQDNIEHLINDESSSDGISNQGKIYKDF